MLKLRKFITIALLACTFSTAYACSCTDAMTLETQTASAQEIFVGRVIATKIATEENKGSEAEILVSEVLKGNAASKTTVFSGTIGSSCTTHFQTGEGYIILIENSRIAHHCTGTRPLALPNSKEKIEIIKSLVQNTPTSNKNQSTN